MGLHRITRPPLSNYVDYLWESAGYVQPHARERILPMGTMELVIDLDARGRASCSLSGAGSRFFVLDTSRPRTLIAAHFKPGGGFPFFGRVTRELRDLSVPLDELWGHDAEELRDRLSDTPQRDARFRVFERFLAGRLDASRAGHPAVRYARAEFQKASGRLSVAEVTDRVGLSSRRFIELFRNEVGLTPKVFARVARFRRALRAIESSTEVDWAALAASCEYFDQAHFIHDFRAFSGTSPSAYLRDRTANLNHVRVSD